MSLRSAGAHIRIVTQHESFKVSPNHTTISLVKLGTSEATDLCKVSRVHQEVSTRRMFDEVLLPCVSNVFSGESFTFLVCGPRESGRSVTLYGNVKVNEKGLIELAAEELLRAARSHEATITRSHFMVEGGDIVDGLDPDRPVEIREFPAPVGVAALPTMVPLEEASHAVFIASRRSRSSSVFTQLHVYSSSSTGPTRRTLGVLTFVDVCAVTDHHDMPSDLRALRKAAHLVSSGQDAAEVIKSCRLVQLLEPALMGSTTLTCLTTVCGNPSLFTETREALYLTAAIHRVQQVLVLVHLQTPKWVFEVATHMPQVCEARSALIGNSYATGVLDYFQATQRVIERVAVCSEDIFDAAVAEGAAAKRKIAQECAADIAQVKEALRIQNLALDAANRDKDTAQQTVSRAAQEERELDSRICHFEDALSTLNEDGAQHIQYLQSETYSIRTRSDVRRRELVTYREVGGRHIQECEASNLVIAEYEANYQHRVGTLADWERLGEAKHKRRRLEQKMEAASQRAAGSLRQSHHAQHQQSTLISQLSLLTKSVSNIRAQLAKQQGVHSVDTGKHIQSENNAPTASSDDGSKTARHYVEPQASTSATTTEIKSPRQLRPYQQLKESLANRKRMSSVSEHHSIASLYLA